MKNVLAIAALLLLARFAEAGPCTAVTLDAPEANVQWRMTGVRWVFAKGEVVMALREHDLQRIDAASGKVLWSHPRFDEEMVPEVAFLDGAVAVAEDRFVVLLDAKSGEERARTDAGAWIRFLVAEPLLAVTQETSGKTSTLVRFSRDGMKLGSRSVPLIADVTMVDGVLAAETSKDESHKDDSMSGYDAATLEPLWSRHGNTFSKQIVGGRLYLGDIDWSEGAEAIDPRSGASIAKVPVRDAFEMGGSEEFDLQVTDSHWTGNWDPKFATCESLRRNDALTAKAKWRIDLPFRVAGKLRDGDRLYVAGSRDAKHHYLVAIDWATGKIERAWSTGFPKLWRMFQVGERILEFNDDYELVAIRPFYTP